jgi:replicative DNA helicase
MTSFLPQAPTVGHVPPHASKIEAAVLGAAMLETSAPRTVFALLHTETAFYVPAHQFIFRALRTLFDEGLPIDQLTAVAELAKQGLLQRAGGPAFVAGLTMQVNSAAHLEGHCRIVQQFHIRREIITTGRRLTDFGYDDTRDPLELMTDAQVALSQLHRMLDTKEAQTASDLYHAYFADLTKKVAAGGLTGIPTPITELNRFTGGWQNSDLIVIAGRPGMGKTAKMLSIVRTAALDHGHPCAIVSLEMPILQLFGRMVSSEVTGHTNAQLRRGEVKGGAEGVVHLATEALRLNSPLIHFDEAKTLVQLRAKAARLVAEKGVKLLLIDYLQLIAGIQKGNREQEIASITRGLKELAKELDIPVILLSQLSRKVEERGGTKRPGLGDLRESGSIEQDADMVIFLWRGDYYGIEEYEDGSETAGTALLDIAKHRNGALGEIVAGVSMDRGLFFDRNKADDFADVQVGPTRIGGTLPASTEHRRDDDEDLPF